ncbi:Golgi complex component 7-domain-containing protein [Irpex rosettiformis]|uniref:Golgi complex component 7-domain-containing protein n=1 Tax=Irpex rosettiformis TaxID=378272 RepID=A0ACB8U3J7_9APHY|nr:Golgi complex component 7-domain-containing protein [Irpex rosettiformis]
MEAIEETSDLPEELTTLSTSELISSLENHEDAVSWINEVLSVDDLDSENKIGSATALTDLDKRVTNLVGTLELASEDTSLQVERIIDDISRGASRLTYDLHFMRDGALSLQDLLQNVEIQAKTSLSPDTNAALERLHFLDTVKRNMEAAREVLREAESWSTLESDVISLLGEQNYERAAERLSEASKSMVVFQNTPEFETRRTLMVSLQNQLEASLSSALVAAVNSQDVVVCKDYFSIFCNIQRESEFRNYYYGSRKAPLVELWQNARLKDGDGAGVSGGDSEGAGSVQTFAQFLPTFFVAFLTMLSTERTSISAIFPDPQSTLSTLITSTLSSLQPSFSERLSAVASYHGAKALPQLIAAYQATQEFAVSASKILEKIGYSTHLSTSGHDVDGTEKKLRRRSSARLSISRRMGPHRASISGNSLINIPSLPTWDSELVEPFADYQADYSSLETRFLSDALRTIFKEDTRSTIDKARLLRERSVDVFSVADEAITRCQVFTHGYGVTGLVQALESFFKSFIDKSKAEVGSSQTGVSGGLTASASGDLSDLDYTSEDWATIQTLLHTLEAVRALHDKLIGYENRLRTTLVAISHTFRLSRADPVGFHPGGTTKGTIQVLAQSTLNNMDLHDLLERVDPDQPPTTARHDQSFLTPTPPIPDTRRTPTTSVFPLGTPGPILPDSRQSISALAKHCQVALQDVILSPLRKRLSTYASLPVWSSTPDSKSKRGGNASSAVSVPTFSLSPSETMQRLSEGLLNLPRLFEVYADDDALSSSLDTLPFINTEMLKALSEPSVEASPVPGHTRRTASLSMKTPPVLAPVAPTQLSLPPEAVSAVWLSSLGLSLLAHLTGTVLPGIRTLSTDGAAQLASDLGYLSSIVMALNIEDGELDRWKECVDMEDGVGRERYKEEFGGGRKEGGDKVLGVVGKLRGWAV